MMRRLTSVLVLCVLAACAEKPEYLASRDVGPAPASAEASASTPQREVLNPVVSDVTPQPASTDPAPRRGGFLDRVLGRNQQSPRTEATADEAVAEAVATDVSVNSTVETPVTVTPDPVVEKKPGLFGRIFKPKEAQPQSTPATATAERQPLEPTVTAVNPSAGVESASVPDAPVAQPASASQPKEPRQEWLERRAERRAEREAARAKRKADRAKAQARSKAEREEKRSLKAGNYIPIGMDEVEVTPESGRLPYGSMVKVCGLSTSALGTKVKTMGGFELYDTRPGSTGLRTHYVAGFRDRCVRKFSGALATFGDPYLHEFIHYRQRNPKLSVVDREYESIKQKVCKAPQLKRCEKNQAALFDNIAFLSIYKSFGVSTTRATVLFFNGRKVAEDFS